MPKEIYDFLDSQRIGVISVEMEDGSPHGATVHFAYQKDPFTFVFFTDRKYRKIQPILANKTTRASLVVGTDEQDMRTLQLDGVAALPTTDEFANAYFAKFPEKKEKSNGPDDVFFIFTPAWWRYTDYKAQSGKRILSSEQD
jgi:general stress protein 26